MLLFGVTIEGPGRDLLAISGNSNGDFVTDPGECRPFHLSFTTLNTPRLTTIRNLTVQDGVAAVDEEEENPDYYRGSSGGLIYGDDPTLGLILENCRLTRGRAQRDGGALFGGISYLRVYDTEISDSQALGEGGGVYDSWSGYFSDSLITGNKARQGGGAVSSGAFVATTISYNTAEGRTAYGGGVAGEEHLSFVDCAIIGNKAVTVLPDDEIPVAPAGWANGGGVWVAAAGARPGTHVFVNTTIANNVAEGHTRSEGGGVSYFLDAIPTSAGGGSRGAMRFYNSTISGNIARSAGEIPGVTQISRGGGIDSIADENYLDFCTVTDNYAETRGSGIYVVNVDETGFHSDIEIYNSIIAGNDGEDVDIGRTTQDHTAFVSRGYNVIGTGSGAVQFTAEGDQTGIEDPGLGPLADNGGAVMTHALLPGSPALDTGDPNPTVRKFPLLTESAWQMYSAARTSGDSFDIGSIAFMPATAPSAELSILSIEVDESGEVVISFASTIGKTYFIEYTDDLAEEFVRIEKPVTATSGASEFVDPGPPLTPEPLAAATQRYYRIAEEE